MHHQESKKTMSDILLAKPVLDKEWTDWSVGEGTLIRRNLFRYFPQLTGPDILQLNKELSINDLEYQNPAGYKPLVDFLEAKHKAPVVITNGAKQALAGVFYALKHKGHGAICLQPLHWALLPPLAKAQGLGCVFREPTDTTAQQMAYLLVSPGNPQPDTYTYADLKNIEEAFKKAKSPLIHDGAYYTKSYLPSNYELGPIGDVQIFSFSKMMGISAARCGYAVCYNEDFYKAMVEYVEMDTVGVSVFSQKFVHSALLEMEKAPDQQKAFEEANYKKLKEAKQLLKGISDKVLEVPKDIEEQNGMFAFVGLKNKGAFEKAKIHIVGGEHFGSKDKVRLNLAIGNENLKKCVEKLNEVVQ